MSSWLCLRDCFVYDRFHYEGKVYDLPDRIEKSPKNFRLVGEAPTLLPAPQSPVKTYQCPKCGKVLSTALALSGHSRSHKKEGKHATTTG